MSVVLNLEKAAIYQKEHLILQNVTLKITKGEFVYLIGKTGSGKSSLLKTIYAELPLKQGSGEAVGFNLNTLTMNEVPFLRRKLGIVFQDFRLLEDRSVHANLEFVLKATNWDDQAQINGRIKDVLDRVGLRDIGAKMPYELSGGEQQRVVIARAMLNRPELIIADEPTGNLDPETSDEIIDLMQRLARTNNMAFLIATHNYNLIQKFKGRIFKCIDAKVREVRIDID